MKITVYGRPNCPWCDAAKNLLERKGWSYEYVDLVALSSTTAGAKQAQAVLVESAMKTVPIVKIDDIYIGGYNHLEGYIRGVEERKQ